MLSSCALGICGGTATSEKLIVHSAEGKNVTASQEDSFVPSCYLVWASRDCFAKIPEPSSAKRNLSKWDLGQKKAKVRDLQALLISLLQTPRMPISLFKQLTSGFRCQLNSICSRIFG